MNKYLGSALSAVLLAAAPSAAWAGELKLSLNNGRATVIATEVPLNQILSEWARVGKTTIVNGDKLTGPPVTLTLQDVTEREALDVLLRSASGYIVAARQGAVANASAFDRILIMPTSRPPAVSAATTSTPPRFPNRPAPQPMLEPDVDEDPPVGPVMGPDGQVIQPNAPQMQPGQPVTYPSGATKYPGQPTAPPTAPSPAALPNAPMTAPRPGMPTGVAPGQPSPYTPPGVKPPGGGGGEGDGAR